MTSWTPLCIHLILLITPMITDQIGLHLVLLLLLIVSIKAIPPGKQWHSSSVLLCVPSRCVRVSLYPYFLFRTESVESYNNVFMPQEKKFCNFLNLQEITGAKIVCIFNCKDSARPDQLSVPCTLLLDNSSVNLSYLRDRPEELKSMTRD